MTTDISQALIQQLVNINYRTGRIHWSDRPDWMFANKRAWRSFNANFAGRETNPTGKKFKMLGKTWQKSRASWFYHTGELPDGVHYKIMTIDRSIHNVSIENLVCVPTHVANRQKKGQCEIRNTTTYMYGTCYRKGYFVGYYNDLDGKVHQKDFKSFEEAHEWRLKHEPSDRYMTMADYDSGELLLNDPGKLSIPVDFQFQPAPPISKETRAKMSLSASRNKGVNGNNYRGIIVGTSDEGQVKFCGGGDAQRAGFTPSLIYACISGRRNQHKGYTWERIDNG